MASRPPRVAIVGTFDVGNFGDLLFPIIAQHALAARVPGLEVTPFSYHAHDAGAWPYDVRPLSQLGDALGAIDLVLVGGGHLIRFDKTVAFGYGPPSPDLHHPTAYGLMPTLLAGWTGVPVAWNALGVSAATPPWAVPLLAEAARAVAYLAVRDEPSAIELRRIAPDVDVAVVPDSAFGLAALEPGASDDAVALREELELTGPYVVFQPSPDLVPFGPWVARALRWYAEHGLAVVELPISPDLGDAVGIVEVGLPTVAPRRWPAPLALAGLVAGAEAVIARSLHLSIAALTAGVPVVRRTSEPGSKYRLLEGLEGIHVVTADDAPDRPLPLGRGPVGADVAELAGALDPHWDAIASLVGARPEPRGRTLAAAIGRLTGLEESAATQATTGEEGLERLLTRAEDALELERSRGAFVGDMLAERDERLRRAHAWLDEVQSSASWRLTRPLRRARALLRRASSTRAAPEPRPAPSRLGPASASLDVAVPAAVESPAPPVPSRPPLDDPVTTVPLLEHVADLPTSPVRKIAFYLPQFHPIPENDAWWGRGFTEWTNVTKARPLFEGHHQPHRPGELGYYDLRVVETQRRQVELAKLYGVDAFCFHFYWFAGRRLLERPLEQYLADPSLDLPFCLCWANESWSRRWDGREDDILLEQSHSEEDDIAFVDYVGRYLADPRYVRVDGRPVLVVYRPGLLPDARATVARWRDRHRETTGEELFVAHSMAFDDEPPEAYGCDASIEFPPVRLGANARAAPRLEGITPLTEAGAYVFDGRFFVAESERYRPPDRVLLRGVCPSWDNTPRRGPDAYVLWGMSPARFQTWLRNALVETEERLPGDERLVFVNAWNEWGEGCYLEPDERRGYAYLEAVRVASVRAAARPRADAGSQAVRAAAVVDASDAVALAELLERLAAHDQHLDLVVTTGAERRDTVDELLAAHGRAAQVLTVHGGGLVGFLDALAASETAAYDVLLRLAGPAGGSTGALDDLLDPDVVSEIVQAFAREPQLGLVGAASDRARVGDVVQGAELERSIAHRLGIELEPERDTCFLSGTVFVRPAALAPLRAIELSPEELGEDGLLVEAVGRCFGISALAAGFRAEDTLTFRRQRAGTAARAS